MGASGDDGFNRERYGRDTLEFARVANLSDALFAIAMTLLVLSPRPRRRLADLPATSASWGSSPCCTWRCVRCGRRELWRRPFPDGLFPWLLAGWGSSTVVTLLALVVALAVPWLGLVMLVLTWPAEAVVAWRAPPDDADWA